MLSDHQSLDIQRTAANLMSQCLSYTTSREYLSAPDRLQRLYRVGPSRSAQMPPRFVRIDSMGDPLESGQNSPLALQTVLAACAGDQSHELVFLVINDGQINRLYLGVRRQNGFADEFMESFRHFFRQAHPGSQLVPIDPRAKDYSDQIVEPLKRIRHAACLTGIPSAKVNRDGSLVSCLDGLLTGIQGHPFSYMVVARPIGASDINDIIARCRDLVGQIHHMASINFTQGVTETVTISEGSTKSTQITRSRTENKGVNMLGAGTLLGGALAGLSVFFPPAGLASALGYTLGIGALPFLSQSRSRSLAIGESISETTARSSTDTYGIAQARQLSLEIVNAHVQAAERHLERYAERFYSERATGLWNAEVYCLSERPDVPALASAQIQAVLNGAESALEPVRWHLLSGLMNTGSVRDALRACESAPVVFGAADEVFCHPLGRSYEGLGTPLTTYELTSLFNCPRREIPGLRLVPTASFSLNCPVLGSDSSIELGTLIDNGVELTHRFTLPCDSMAKHTLLAGINGSGKSSTCRALIREVAQHGIPFLVIEPAKDEYVEWAMGYNQKIPPDDPRRIAIYMPGMDVWRGHKFGKQLALNPLEVIWLAPDQSPRVVQHIDGLKAILGGSMPMADVLPIILEQLLYAVYSKHPSDWLTQIPDYSNALFPTITDLAAQAKPLLDSKGYEPRYKMQLTEALNTRIGSLDLPGWKRSLFNPKPGHMTNWAELFDRPTVINLSQLTDIKDRSFTMALILQFLYEYRIAQAQCGQLVLNSGRLRHLTVVEEAHRVMARPHASPMGEANPQAMAAQMFSDMLSEIRAYGEGFLIVEQVPERLIADAVKNTNLKIVHRLVSRDDRDAISGCMNLKAAQAAMISRLRPGQAIISGDGDDSAFWIKVTP
jgi:hypothetical protein